MAKVSNYSWDYGTPHILSKMITPNKFDQNKIRQTFMSANMDKLVLDYIAFIETLEDKSIFTDYNYFMALKLFLLKNNDLLYGYKLSINDFSIDDVITYKEIISSISELHKLFFYALKHEFKVKASSEIKIHEQEVNKLLTSLEQKIVDYAYFVIDKYNDNLMKLFLKTKAQSKFDEFGFETDCGLLEEDVDKFIDKIINLSLDEFIDLNNTYLELLKYNKLDVAAKLELSLHDLINSIYNSSYKYEDMDGHDNIETMNGVQFEEYVLKLLQDKGYIVCKTKITGDFGADLIAEKNGIKISIQVKRYTGNVGLSAVQEVIASMKHYSTDQGWVITNSKYTLAAKKLASTNDIKLCHYSTI